MLKKVFVLIFSAFIVLSLIVFNNAPVFSEYADEYEVYLTDFSCSEKIISVNKFEYPFIFNVKGESAIIKNQNFSLTDFLNELNAQVVHCESGEDYTCYYAYSPTLKRSKVINDKLVNLHIAITQKGVKVGSPIIYGSF
jgi:hypothetical protein